LNRATEEYERNNGSPAITTQPIALYAEHRSFSKETESIMTDKKIIGIKLDKDTAKALADALDTIGTIAVIDVSEKQGIPPEELMERASAKGNAEDEDEEYVPAKHNGHDPMYG
jgi:hypothetical protein